ncbi:hypothetical protein OHB37_30875 (plasmid) [Streptomyces albidoflavus]|uniref:hypothetical protein n=1 Tax=Streptomyces TaxID=1883 RepID=UPI0004CA68AE|nr:MULTISPECIES: hypothetical protein [Streptomyces]MBT2880715.1 hypothetical protein [Streptomyces sp. McG6]MBT2887830.1 hypothetical protein [Streptomyces sp. McG5]MBT2893732.1 hypothetical protein [Streptomyces sp. McG2]WSB18611.1 hypothetical protein OHB37_30875 [Streptomyces albidoflavus]
MGQSGAQGTTCPICGERTFISPNWKKMYIHTPSGQTENCWASGLTASGILRTREAKQVKLARELSGSLTPMAMPVWFPRWDGETYPTIALFARRRMAYWLPETNKVLHEDKIQDLLGKQVRPRWESEHACWTMADVHFIDLADELLRRYPNLSIGREYNENEKCYWQCQRAQGWRCTCSCQARNHAGGSWMDPWNVLSEDNSIIDQVTWTWMAVELKTPEAH